MLLGNAIPENVRQALESGDWQPQELAPVYTCQTCEDRHVISYDVPFGDERFGKLYPCPDCGGGQKLMERRWKSRLKQAELPKEYQQLTFATWQQLPQEARQGKGLALACAQLFVQSDDHSVSLATAYRMAGRDMGNVDIVRKSLILQGVPGLGKTGLAAAIVNHLLAEGKPVLYIRVQDFIEAVKDAFGKEKRQADGTLPDSAQEIVSVVKRAPRLVLDEFNVSVVGDWRQEVMENVIRYRYGNALPTVITCNAQPDELEAQWGLRTTSVLFTMAHWVPMGGEVLRDMRQPDEVF